MSTTGSPSAELITLNGIDATTGGPYGSPLTAEAISEAVLGERLDPDTRHALKARAAAAEAHFGVRAGVDAGALDQAGWGVIFAWNCPQQVIEALKPLLDLRRSQAGSRFKQYTGASGYRPGDTVLQFLTRNGMGPGVANPDKVPYYLLLVGGPEAIPLPFQYRLDVDYAVGRIAFDDPELYARYAQSIAAQEAGPRPGSRRAVLFSVANPGDAATARSDTDLMAPLDRSANQWAGTWGHSLISGSGATKAQLSAELHASDAPGILLSASHGVGFPLGDPRQTRQQGAILCRDWPGPLQHQGPLPESFYFSGEDLDATANVKGTVAFLFACYGAGTPQRDYFPEQGRLAQKDIAPRDFLAWLPTRMLAHERGSARAVVAHVERVWTYSFSWPKAGPQTEPFEDALRLLAAGAPVGFAMEAFGQRYASLNTDICDLMDLLRADASFRPDPVELGSLWTARNDARSFVILGDPAIRAV